MIIDRKIIKDACADISNAIDSKEITQITETLELKTVNKALYLNLSNREYYTRVKLAMDTPVDFHATVNADKFLELVKKTTSETIELNVVNNYLEFKGNGTNKFPMIMNGEGNLLEIPEINIENVNSEFNIKGEILHSIMEYNSKQIDSNNTSLQAVQRKYYIDDKGAITYTSGACVNNFHLDSPIKILLDAKIVKLFKLFGKDDEVHFTIGHDPLSDEIIQTKVKFETDNYSITAILSCDDSLVGKVPADTIRSLVSGEYPYKVSMGKSEFINALDRLMVFMNPMTPFGNFKFTKDSVTVSDLAGDNSEVIMYKNTCNEDFTYDAMMDIDEVRTTLAHYNGEHLNINFGDETAIVFVRNNIYNVIPEVH